MPAPAGRSLPIGFNSKFALLAISNVHSTLSGQVVQLSDGTSVLPAIPTEHLGVWREWIGTIRVRRLEAANVVLLIDTNRGDPSTLDAEHTQLGDHLTRILYLTQLSGVLEYDGADLLLGSSVKGEIQIRQMSRPDNFCRSRGYIRSPLTFSRLENALSMSVSLKAMEAAQNQFTRFIRGLSVLMDGLKEIHGDERLHQCVRALEALVAPERGHTERQFVHRCQTFVVPVAAAKEIPAESFRMRSDTEHLNEWDSQLGKYPIAERQIVAWHRTRQIEHLASAAHERVLMDANLQQHFKDEAALQLFWKSTDDSTRKGIWGSQIDLARIP